MSGADPGFFLAGGGALVSCSTSTPINHIVFFLFGQNTSCIRKPQVILGRGGGGVAQPLHPPPRSAAVCRCQYLTTVFCDFPCCCRSFNPSSSSLFVAIWSVLIKQTKCRCFAGQML